MPVSPNSRRALGLTALALTAILAGQAAPVRAAGSVVFHSHWTVNQRYTELQVSKSLQTFSMTVAGSTQKINQNQTSTDTFTLTITVIKVYKDGSADAKITFPSGTHAEGGKVQTVPLKSYYRIQHLAANGETLSTKTYGESTVPAALRGNIPDTHGSKFPSAPIPVGGSWDESRAIAPFGTLTLHNKLVAAGTKNGHPVATIHSVLSQRVSISQQGLTFSGPFTGTQDSQLYTDSFFSAAPTHSTYSLTGKLSGKVSGTAVTGTFAFTGEETDTPQP